MSSTGRAAAEPVLTFLLPGVGSTIFTTTTLLKDFCTEMKSETAKFSQAIVRIEFLHGELLKIENAQVLEHNNVLPQLSTTIIWFKKFIEEHATKRSLSRFIARHEVDEKILAFNSEIDRVFQALNLVHIAEMAERRMKFDESRQHDTAMIMKKLNNIHTLVVEYMGRDPKEALTTLQFAITGREETKSRHFTPDDVTRMQRTLEEMLAHAGANLRLEELPPTMPHNNQIQKTTLATCWHLQQPITHMQTYISTMDCAAP